MKGDLLIYLGKILLLWIAHIFRVPLAVGNFIIEPLWDGSQPWFQLKNIHCSSIRFEYCTSFIPWGTNLFVHYYFSCLSRETARSIGSISESEASRNSQSAIALTVSSNFEVYIGYCSSAFLVIQFVKFYLRTTNKLLSPLKGK